MNYYQFLFENVSEEQKDQLIALLNNISFEGFEEKQDQLAAFIPENEFNEAEFEKTILHLKVKFSKSIIKSTNWNNEWESNFNPVTVLHPETNLPFCHIRASFHPPGPEATHEIIITPKMSFGTGHHATTTLMIEQMALMDFRDRSVIDFGTGTGILAILAEKSGASKIEAIDNDEWSIKNALENIEANSCFKITASKTGTPKAGFKADIILANINLNVIVSNLKNILKTCKETAYILFSGILVSDVEYLKKELKINGFQFDKSVNKNGWALISTSVKKSSI